MWMCLGLLEANVASYVATHHDTSNTYFSNVLLLTTSLAWPHPILEWDLVMWDYSSTCILKHFNCFRSEDHGRKLTSHPRLSSPADHLW